MTRIAILSVIALVLVGCGDVPTEGDLAARPSLALAVQTAGCGANDLIDAINAANATSGSTITLAAGCTYLLTDVNNVSTEFGINGLPIITSSTTIDGNGATIERSSVGPNFRIFYVLNTGDPADAPVELTLNDLTISGSDFSKSGSGLFNDGGTVTLNRVTLSGNSASDDGGGLHNELGTVRINHSTISANRAGDLGGGVSNNGGTVTIHNSTISGNHAADAGGGVSNEGGTVNIDRSTLSDNTGDDSGGGLANLGGAVNISDATTISGNHVGDDGGGLRNEGAGTLTVSNSTISGNSALDDGGGLANSGGTVNITNSVILGNRANDAGAGLHNDNGGTLTVRNSTLSANEAAEDGGGLYNYDATATVTRSAISGNSAKWGAGAVNTTAEAGGVLAVMNSTISANRAGEGAGGLFNDKGGNLTLTHSTVSGNEALTKGGGGVLSYNDINARAEVKGSIIAGNSPDDVAAVEDKTRFNSLGHNLIGRVGAIVTFNQDFVAAGDQRNVTDPKLGALQNNGGPTFTRALLPGSPALDAGGGDCAATDQRGISRPQGVACDIGAFESSPATILFDQPPSLQTYGTIFNVDPTATTGQSVSLAGTAGVCAVAPATAPATGSDVTMLSGTGTCTLTASQAGVDPIVRTVQAQKVVLTVRANDKIIAFGDASPIFDVIFSGFVSPDNAGSLSGSLSLTFQGMGTTAYGPSVDIPTAVGTYSVTPGGLNSDNYNFTFVAGAFTITAPAQVAEIRFQSHTNAQNGSANSLRISRPAGVSERDFLLAQIAFEKGSDAGSDVQLTPAGWTLVRRTDRGTDVGQAIFFKVATDAEPSSYVWTFSQSVIAAGGIVRYSGVDPAAPIVNSSGNTGDSNTLTAPGVEAGDRSLLVAFFGLKKTSTNLTTPPDMASRYYFESGQAAAILGADELRAAAGSTGDRTSTAGSADKWVAQLVALRPD